MAGLMPDVADEDGERTVGRSRLGPRPLALHVAHAEWAWRTGDPPRLSNFFRGVKAYRNHPYRRTASTKPVVWRSGSSRLLDYGPNDGWPLLVVPSLINRAYVLDLAPETSLLRFLSAGGMRPFLLDWGQPGSVDRQRSLDHYVLERMQAAFDWMLEETDRPPLVLGYCMGGTLAVALACRRRTDMAGLALLAAPWDFKGDRPAIDHLDAVGHALSSYAGMVGSTSVDLLQTLFAIIDPMAVPQKFARFAKMNPTSEAALRFVAIEDWLNDGVPLGADLAASCLLDWYGSNAPARGRWTVAGQKVEPETLDIPGFFAIPARDRIVPAGSALALAAALPRAEIIRPASGHIGMVAGRKARGELWTPLLAWLLQIAAMQKK